MYFDMFHKLQEYETLHPEDFDGLTKDTFEQILSTDYALPSTEKKILFCNPPK